MSEIEQEVKTYRVKYQCDACGEGEMRPTGGVLLSCPAQYTHACTNCGETDNFRDRYPKVLVRQG